MAETIDHLAYYDVEKYLFGTVRRRFTAEGVLDAVDFFTIIRWKSARAVTHMGRRLLAKGHGDLHAAVAALTHEISNAGDPEARLRVLVEGWGFQLPMASAILTVLFPEEFTVYDYRVCEQIGGFGRLANTSVFSKLWAGCQEFTEAVRRSAPKGLSLRDKDRWLWGKSAREGLVLWIDTKFAGGASVESAG